MVTASLLLSERQFGIDAHTEIVSAIAFSPGSQRLVTASYDASIRLWDFATCKELKELG